ncbi:MAG: EscU/YscU/HrcU family type III secretion system export apparatus switch protein [Treponema sp.]
MKKQKDCSVALSYVFGEQVPLITASGRGAVAQRIREIAEECRIPLISDSFLAEVLVEAEIGSCIPEETYQAVAAIFAFIHRRNEVCCAKTD